MSKHDWISRARCNKADTELFFLDTGGRRQEEWSEEHLAQLEHVRETYCWQCPVRVQCLKDCLRHGEEFGIRAGLTEHERKRISQVTCNCGKRIDPIDMLSPTRRHFCPDCRPIVFTRSVRIVR